MTSTSTPHVGPDVYEPVVSILESLGLAGRLELKIATKNNVYLLGDESLVAANRICALLSSYKVLLIALFLLLLLFALFAISRLLIALSCRKSGP